MRDRLKERMDDPAGKRRRRVRWQSGAGSFQAAQTVGPRDAGGETPYAWPAVGEARVWSWSGPDLDPGDNPYLDAIKTIEVPPEIT